MMVRRTHSSDETKRPRFIVTIRQKNVQKEIENAAVRNAECATVFI